MTLVDAMKFYDTGLLTGHAAATAKACRAAFLSHDHEAYKAAKAALERLDYPPGTNPFAGPQLLSSARPPRAIASPPSPTLRATATPPRKSTPAPRSTSGFSASASQDSALLAITTSLLSEKIARLEKEMKDDKARAVKAKTYDELIAETKEYLRNGNAEEKAAARSFLKIAGVALDEKSASALAARMGVQASASPAIRRERSGVVFGTLTDKEARRLVALQNGGR